MVVRVFSLSFAVTALALLAAFVYDGPHAVVLTAILGVLEVSLSFDNAVVNATVLQRMSERWQRVFLTLGVLIAVLGMRLLFPLLVVAVGAHLDPVRALDLALNPPTDGSPTYVSLLTDANPKIATFGGMFLLLLFLNFVCAERDRTWLSWLERPLARLGRFEMFPVVVALIVLVITAGLIAPNAKADVVMVAGVLGMVTYFLVDGLADHFENSATADDEATGTRKPARATLLVGRAAFFGFLYLEMLDASFSFDGVVGSFAVTADPILIALGLGLIGAMFVRSMTVYLVRTGTLDEYVYLEHGAHWAIGGLALVLVYSTRHKVDELVSGLIGVAIILAALVSSIVYNRRQHTLAVPEVSGATVADSEIQLPGEIELPTAEVESVHP